MVINNGLIIIMVAEEGLNFALPCHDVIGGLCEMLFEVFFGFPDCFLMQVFHAMRTATKNTLCLGLDYFVSSTTTETNDFAHVFSFSKERLLMMVNSGGD
jgi:hypothetical protein